MTAPALCNRTRCRCVRTVVERRGGFVKQNARYQARVFACWPLSQRNGKARLRAHIAFVDFLFGREHNIRSRAYAGARCIAIIAESGGHGGIPLFGKKFVDIDLAVKVEARGGIARSPALQILKIAASPFQIDRQIAQIGEGDARIGQGRYGRFFADFINAQLIYPDFVFAHENLIAAVANPHGKGPD